MVLPQSFTSDADEIPLNPLGGHFASPMDVIWDRHFDHDRKIETLKSWLARERLLYRADRDSDHIAQMRQIEHAIRTLVAMRRAEGAY